MYDGTADGSLFCRIIPELKAVLGHIILLNPVSSEFYEQTQHQAMEALKTYPGGLQIGGGITPENAGEYLEAGASHGIDILYLKDACFVPTVKENGASGFEKASGS